MNYSHILLNYSKSIPWSYNYIFGPRFGHGLLLVIFMSPKLRYRLQFWLS